jgi:putative glycosyltransferase
MLNPTNIIKTISVVTTTYNSEKFIDEFVHRTLKAINECPVKLEKIIIVDDGSTDLTQQKLNVLSKRHIEVTVLTLSRNFGHHLAILEGLRHAESELVFLIDSDLEEIPENFSTIYERFSMEDVDVVYGVQERRRGGVIEKLQGVFFYDFFSRFLGVPIPKNLLTSRLMTKEYVHAILAYPERQVFLAGIFLDAGFNQISLNLNKLRINKSNYTFKKKVLLSLRMATSFSVKPLYYLAAFSFAYFLFSMGTASFLFLRQLFIDDALSGWTSIMLSVWISTGVMSVILSIISVYLAQLLIESKKRPRSIVRINEQS